MSGWRAGSRGNSDRPSGDVFVRIMHVLKTETHMDRSIWDGSNNSTLWGNGALEFFLFSFQFLTQVFFMTFTDGGVGIIIPGRGFFVYLYNIVRSTLYTGGRAPGRTGIEDGRTESFWTDIIIFSHLPTQTDGQTGSVAARGSVGPIEFPSIMRKTKERIFVGLFIACDLVFVRCYVREGTSEGRYE